MLDQLPEIIDPVVFADRNSRIVGQVAMLGNSQLHKPGNQENAIRQLQKSSGKRIKFYTGICVLDTTTMSYKLDIDIGDENLYYYTDYVRSIT
jgi:predicted house-cleaning NTP pyrophosphatase (Maf/HAM1 superfamily)